MEQKKKKHSCTNRARLRIFSPPSWVSTWVVAAEDKEVGDNAKRVVWTAWPFWVSRLSQWWLCSLSYIVRRIKLTFKARDNTNKFLIDKTLVIKAIGLEENRVLKETVKENRVMKEIEHENRVLSIHCYESLFGVNARQWSRLGIYRARIDENKKQEQEKEKNRDDKCMGESLMHAEQVSEYLIWILWVKLLVQTQETEIWSTTYKSEKQILWKRAWWRLWDFGRTPKPWKLTKIYWILGFLEPLCMEISGVYVWNLIYPVKTSIQIFSFFQWMLAEWIPSTSMIFQSFPRRDSDKTH